MIEATPEYGTLAPLVKAVGWLISAATAIGFSWRGRTNWEPSEQDISKAPAKVSGLLSALLLALVWTQESNRHDEGTLVILVWGLGGATLLFLLIYGLITSSMTFTEVYSPVANETASRKIIGGFRLTPEARAIRKEKHLTTQEVFAGSAYIPDKVWIPILRALAKQVFVLCYMGLTVCGAIALASAAILLLLPRT